MSFAHFLNLMFNARHLVAADRNLQASLGWVGLGRGLARCNSKERSTCKLNSHIPCARLQEFVRYLASRDTIYCLHYSRITPHPILLPPPQIGLRFNSEAAWLRQEIKDLTEQADEVFSVIELALQEAAAETDEACLERVLVEDCRKSRNIFLEMVSSCFFVCC